MQMLKLLIAFICLKFITTTSDFESINDDDIFAVEVRPRTSPRYVLTLKDEDFCAGAQLILCPLVEHKPTQMFRQVNKTLIKNVVSGHFLTVDPQMNDESDVTKILLTIQMYHGREGQKWTKKKGKLASADGKLCVDINEGKPTFGAKVIYKPCDEDVGSQQFGAAFIMDSKFHVKMA